MVPNGWKETIKILGADDVGCQEDRQRENRFVLERMPL
jgi:hypothetical protein